MVCRSSRRPSYNTLRPAVKPRSIRGRITAGGEPVEGATVIALRSQIEAGRQLTYHAARMKDTGKRCDLEAGMAKAFCAEMAEHVTSEAMQVFGGYGYSREFPAQRFWRDARVFRIFEGTSEIQYEVIAKRLLEG